MRQSIITKIKNSVCEDWIVLDTSVKLSIKFIQTKSLFLENISNNW